MSEGRVRLVGLPLLAERAGVPSSVFAFLEARLPQVRALRDGNRRGYRLDDAALLAGMAELLYRDGVAFRDAAAMLRTGEREAIVERGRELLGSAAEEAPAAPPKRAIPADALVGSRGERPAAPRRDPSPEINALLSELIDCVRTLESARGPSL